MLRTESRSARRTGIFLYAVSGCFSRIICKSISPAVRAFDSMSCEIVVSAEHWPVPSYNDILFYA